MQRTPFLVGIDLGTTNSGVAALDTRRDPRIEIIPILQLTAPASVEPRPALPSFLYFPYPHEIENGGLALPWNPRPEWIAGMFARDQGLAPTRLVTSAKSWLAHSGIDRRARLLPWGADPSEQRISAVDASAAYLTHIREAWDATIAKVDESLRLERQTIVLTVPASFDEEARELTVEAARAARLVHLTLLEEPIAAFYAWTAENDVGVLTGRDDHVVLVCDVGGGTTDFSLVRVRLEGAIPAFERIAIGDHLLLGGDNVDLALALMLEQKIGATAPGVRLSVTQRETLRRHCNAAKERLLAEDAPAQTAISLLGSGRTVVGGAVKEQLTRDEVHGVLERFLPISPPADTEISRAPRAALRELGLPYQSDPAITRHLRAFLARSAALVEDGHCAVAKVDGHAMIRPDAVLFNGGFFTPAAARTRLVDALSTWFDDRPLILPTRSLDSAVALGAARYAQIRAGAGVPGALIKAGSGHSYYVALSASNPDGTIPAVCVLARGTDEGTRFGLDHLFMVSTNTPVAFSLYSSTIRHDRVGAIVALAAKDVHEHAPLVTVLRYGRKSRGVELPIRLSVAFTEVGTLELWCESQASDHRWHLQFQLRGSSAGVADESSGDAENEHEAVVSKDAIACGERAIRLVFAHGGGDADAEQLVALLEQTFGYGKTAWPIGVLRHLADVLIAVAEARRSSPRLETRWLNLFGFCLRPGFGAAKDPWRVTEARKIYAGGVAFPSAVQNRVEWVVLWQRVAGGFSPGQQLELARRTMGELGMDRKKPRRLNPQAERESWRLVASLERLDTATRVQIGDQLLARLERDQMNASLLWAIGRAGARVPLYGPLNCVVPAGDAARWLRRLASFRLVTPDVVAALVHIGALTGDPCREIDRETLDMVRERLASAGADDSGTRALHEVLPASTADVSWVFGEPLPNGLRLGGYGDAEAISGNALR